MHDEGVVAIHLRTGHGEEGVGAPEEAGRGTKRHQRIHVGGAVEEALEAVDEELLVDDHHDARQQKLNEAHRDMVAIEPVGERPAPHHVPHGKVHQHRQEEKGGNEPLFQFGGLVVGQSVEVGAGVWGGGGPARLGAGAIACILHRLDDGGSTRGALHAHGVGEQAHRTARDAGHGVYGLFHPCRAGRAAHAGNVVLFHSLHSLRWVSLSEKGSFHEFGQQFQQLIQLFVAARAQVVRDAGAHMLAEQLSGKGVQRRVCRRHLHEDVGTIDVFFDHAADAPDLALDAVQPVDEALVLLLAPLFVAAAAGVQGLCFGQRCFGSCIFAAGGRGRFVQGTAGAGFHLAAHGNNSFQITPWGYLSYKGIVAQLVLQNK